MSAIVMTDSTRIASALSYVPADDRDMWLKMGMAIKSELPESEAFDIWNAWSQSADNYNEQKAKSAWRSFKPDGGIGIGTLIQVAQGNGWTHTGTMRMPTVAEMKERKAQRAAQAEADDAKESAKRAKAMRTAKALWDAAVPAKPDHPYLARKQVVPVSSIRGIDINKAVKILGYTPKSDGKPLTGRILVAPIKFGPVMSSCELIDSDGLKSAIAGGAKAGGYWATQHLPAGNGKGLTLCIGEGIATTLSVSEPTGHIGIAALSSSNLMATAKAMRKLYPEAALVLLADLIKTTGLPDPHAVNAAQEVGALLAIPDFGADRPEGMKDFNDLHQVSGPEAVRGCIDAAVPADDNVPAQETSNAPISDMTAIANALKAKKEAKKAAQLASGLPYGFTLSTMGVFFTPEGTDDKPGTPMRVCAPLRVTALSRDNSSANWGRVIEFNDADGVRHEWAVPMEMLAGDGMDVRRELSRLGLAIASGAAARNRLSEYLIESKPDVRARGVLQTGWFGNVFVMPDRTIGTSNEVIMYQSESKTTCQYAQAGTDDQWRDNVARLCIGNSRLLFAVSASFAGMLLHHAGQESGGLHFVGSSSTGKSTAQLVAASVYGSASFKQSWRATGNALEGTCALHNDAALILDEMAEVEPKEVGSIVYMIGNGVGKGRAVRSGDAKPRKTWRLMIISSGEIGLAQHMRDGGKIAKAGQEVRMIDIAADAGAGHGLFENLHGYDGGATLSNAIKEATQAHYGTPAITFLEHLTKSDLTALPAMLKEAISNFVSDNLPADAGGQAARVCNKFAVIAIAGEYATDAGITGWQEGDAIAAAATCFASWLDSRGGGGNQERTAILSSVKAFFESHGSSRFEDMAATQDQRIINRAGFYRTGLNGDREFLVLPEAFRRELCQGFSEKTVKAVLVDSGMLITKDGKPTQLMRLPGIGPTKAYVIQYGLTDE